MKQEQVEEILKSSPYIKFNGWIEPDDYGFSRTCSFEVRDAEYRIVWFRNYSNLYCGEMEVLFDDFHIDNTWPSRYKRFLQFYRQGRVCAVIPIEEYAED